MMAVNFSCTMYVDSPHITHSCQEDLGIALILMDIKIISALMGEND